MTVSENAVLFILRMAIVAGVFLCASCSYLALDELPRSNPHDSENPVPPAENFTAGILSSTDVILSWTMSSASSRGFLLLRKPGGIAPVNTYDGTVVEMSTLAYDQVNHTFSLIDTNLPNIICVDTFSYRLWTTDRKSHYTDSGISTVNVTSIIFP